MSTREMPKRFLVAFSFAGEQRDLVHSIAEALEQRLGHGRVFYDDWFVRYIEGPGGRLQLLNIYRKRSEIVIPCISERYGDKPWTQFEREAIGALQHEIYKSKDEKDAYRIYPLRVGDGDLEEFPESVIIPDIRPLSADAAADKIIDRLRLIRPAAGHRVFLAECAPEFSDVTKTVNRECVKTFLEEHGWIVVPDAEPSADRRQMPVERQLRDCVAYVELLGSEPSPAQDVNLSELAKEAKKIQRLRFRKADLDPASVPSPHREIVFGQDVIAAGFDDFLHNHLPHELAAALSRWHEPDPPLQDRKPLVPVAIRSERDDAYRQVYDWLLLQEGIRPRKLKPGESLPAVYDASRFHGVMVVCDRTTKSLEEFMNQLELVRLKAKGAAELWPPVAVQYWPPPEPDWSTLVEDPPEKLHFLVGDAPANRNEFVADVWRVLKEVTR